MKFCPTCETEFADDKRFCEGCGTALRSKAGDLVGSVIADRYHILSKLGEGGMGAVYLGEHVKMRRKSAIKVITQSMANDSEAIARFNREAANAARINHPNVCGIYDFGETQDGIIYLAMEFIDGGALTDLLNQEGALPLSRAANILKQTADALDAAHELGIVHRDLKPDNIMITTDKDGNDVVKVVDFGIAKAMGGETEQNVTKTGLVVGTPEYMSPEQLSGDKLDGRSDTYSLGLVFFRMLTGRLPFQADTAQEVMILRLTDDPMPLNTVIPGAQFPPRLQKALDRALARMPGERYERATAFGHDVMAVTLNTPDASVTASIVDGATHVFKTDPEEEGTVQLPQTRVAEATPTPPESITPDTPTPAAAATRPDRKPLQPAPTAEKRKNPIGLVAAFVGVVTIGGAGAFVMLGNKGDATQPQDPPITLAANDSGPTGTPIQRPESTTTNTTPRNNQPQGNDRNTSPPGQPNSDPSTQSNGDNSTTPTSCAAGGFQLTANACDIRLPASVDPVEFSFALDAGTNADVRAALDSAQAAYRMLSQSASPDRTRLSDAAFAAAQLLDHLNDAPQALQWAREANRILPGQQHVEQFLRRLGGQE